MAAKRKSMRMALYSIHSIDICLAELVVGLDPQALQQTVQLPQLILVHFR